MTSSARIELVALAACLALGALVFELVRRGQIKEKYSLLWFVTATSLLALTVRRDWLHKLSNAIGVYYPPSALFLVLSFFTIVMLVHFSMVISRLITQNQKLALELALLKADVEAQQKREGERRQQRSA